MLLINEFSTFFLNYRQFLLVFKKSNTKAYKWNAILFFVSFFLVRIIFNSIVGYWVVKAFYLTMDIRGGLFTTPLWQLVMGLYLIGLFVSIYILNVVWLKSIIAHVRRNLNKGESDESSN